MNQALQNGALETGIPQIVHSDWRGDLEADLVICRLQTQSGVLEDMKDFEIKTKSVTYRVDSVMQQTVMRSVVSTTTFREIDLERVLGVDLSVGWLGNVPEGSKQDRWLPALSIRFHDLLFR